MDVPLERIAELERANYAAMLSSAEVTPGLEVILREDVILTCSQDFPTTGSNHACLLRTSSETADELISEVTDFFREHGLTVAIYLSPASAPDDLAQRLLKRGFTETPEVESWLVLNELPSFEIPPPFPGIDVRQVSAGEADLFAEVFLSAFDLPAGFAPVMAQVMEPTVGLPDVHHYLAFDDGRAIGTCSLLRHGSFGILGSAGVLPEQRRSGAATNLTVRAMTEARDQGIDTLMLQTAADTPLERLLRISGFRREFTRSCFVLNDDATGQD